MFSKMPVEPRIPEDASPGAPLPLGWDKAEEHVPTAASRTTSMDDYQSLSSSGLISDNTTDGGAPSTPPSIFDEPLRFIPHTSNLPSNLPAKISTGSGTRQTRSIDSGSAADVAIPPHVSRLKQLSQSLTFPMRGPTGTQRSGPESSLRRESFPTNSPSFPPEPARERDSGFDEMEDSVTETAAVKPDDQMDETSDKSNSPPTSVLRAPEVSSKEMTYVATGPPSILLTQ